MTKPKTNNRTTNTTETMSDQKLSIPKYNNNQNTSIVSWFKLFSQKYQANRLDNTWKLNNISDYLDGHVFNYYLDFLIDETNWDNLQTSLTRRFTPVIKDTLSTFMDIKLFKEDDIESYFYSKISTGKSIGLTDLHILEGLTEGIELRRLKELVATQNISDLEEWLKYSIKFSRLSQRQDVKPGTRPNYGGSDQARAHVPTVPMATSTARSNNNTWSPRVYTTDRVRSPRFEPRVDSAPFVPRPRYNPSRPPAPASRNYHHAVTASIDATRPPPSPCPNCVITHPHLPWHWKRDCPFYPETSGWHARAFARLPAEGPILPSPDLPGAAAQGRPEDSS